MCQKYSKNPRFHKPVSVVGLYYSHGLVCASYPGTVLGFVSVVVIVCSLPYFITTSGDLNTPKPWRSPWLNYRIADAGSETPQWVINNPTQFSGRTPSWFIGLPLSVVQQVYVQVQVNCSNARDVCLKSRYSISRMVAAHALAEMSDAISKCQHMLHPAVVNLTLSLYPRATAPTVSPGQTITNSSSSLHTKLPFHFSGILSPVLDSIRHNFQNSENRTFDGHSIKELLYGGFWEHYHSQSAGSTNENFVGKNHRFAITFILKASKEEFVELTQCINAIKTVWPEQRKGLKFMKHFYYEPDWHVIDFAPLLGVYIIVFLYISFSVGKIDLVKSKIGLGITACITVFASLTMSLGVCTFFGLSISLSGSEIYPYVVITIGLENILIIVQAVISTPEELDVKYRIAVGLSKEGWAITRNLLTILTMNAMCILFFNYTFKEFSIIALVGLICDAFLQIVFFPTVLSIDLRRLELSDLNSTAIPVRDVDSDRYCPKAFRFVTPLKWKSKRFQFVYFIAQTRIVSKAIMFSAIVFLLAWFTKTETFHNLMSNVIYSHEHSPGLTDSTVQYDNDPSLDTSLDRLNIAGEKLTAQAQLNLNQALYPPTDKVPTIATLDSAKVWITQMNEDGFNVRCDAGEVCWRPMVTTHWPRLLENFNYTLPGRFLSVLPPVNLKFQFGYLNHPYPTPPPSLVARLLSHPNTIRVCFLCLLAAVVFGYSVFLVRLSILRHKRYLQSERNWNYNNRKACLKGHKLDVDCLCITENRIIVTTGLDGEIRVWESHPMRRRCIQVIDRSKHSLYSADVPTGSSVDKPIVNGSNDIGGVIHGGGFNTPNQQSFGSTESNGNSQPLESCGTTEMIKSGVRYACSQNISKPQHRRNFSSGACNYNPFASHNSHLDRTNSSPVSPFATTVPVRRHSGSETPKNIPIYSVPLVQTAPSQNGDNQAKSRSKPNVHSNPFNSRGLNHIHSSGPQSRTHRRALSGPVSYKYLTSFQKMTPNTASTLLTQSSNAASQLSHRISTHHNNHHCNMSQNYIANGDTDTLNSAWNKLPSDNAHVNSLPSSTYSFPANASRQLSLGSSQHYHDSSQQHSQNASCFWNVELHLARNSSSSYETQPVNPGSSQRKDSDTPVVQIHVDPISSPTVSPPSGSESPCQHHRMTHSRHLSLGRNISRSKQNHFRNHSLGSININHNNFPSGSLNSRHSSISNLSMCSNLSSVSGLSAKSANSNFLNESQLTTTLPDPEKGYDFAQHFNLFSQYTSNMALLYCDSKQRTSQQSSVPTVWCMDVWKSVVAVGCGNGQIEAWNISTGSLIFTLSIGDSGVTSISVNSHGILSGHMDGSLILIGHDGLQRYCVPAHSKPVSILRVYSTNVVTGGYDGVVKVHRLIDFVCTNAIYVHPGSISALTWTSTQVCVSGCSKGLIVCWDISSGQCIHEFEEPGVSVLMLESTVDHIISLFAEDCIKVWSSLMGDLVYTIKLDGICNGFAVLGSHHIAVCLESAISVYNVNTKRKHCEKQLDTERGVALVRQVFAFDEATVICSIGKEVHIIPCDLKLKTD